MANAIPPNVMTLIVWPVNANPKPPIRIASRIVVTMITVGIIGGSLLKV